MRDPFLFMKETGSSPAEVAEEAFRAGKSYLEVRVVLRRVFSLLPAQTEAIAADAQEKTWIDERLKSCTEPVELLLQAKAARVSDKQIWPAIKRHFALSDDEIFKVAERFAFRDTEQLRLGLTRSPSDHESELISRLQIQLGPSKFYQFVHATRRSRRLLYWQEKAIERLNAKADCNFPIIYADVCHILETVQFPLMEEVESLPDWIGLESLDGCSPVEGAGELESGERWVFWAKRQSLSILVANSGDDPFAISQDEAAYSHEETYLYGSERESPRDLSLGASRWFIQKHLRIYRSKAK